VVAGDIRMKIPASIMRHLTEDPEMMATAISDMHSLFCGIDSDFDEECRITCMKMNGPSALLPVLYAMSYQLLVAETTGPEKLSRRNVADSGGYNADLWIAKPGIMLTVVDERTGHLYVAAVDQMDQGFDKVHTIMSFMEESGQTVEVNAQVEDLKKHGRDLSDLYVKTLQELTNE